MVDQLKEIQTDMNSLYQQNQETQSQVGEQTQKMRDLEDGKNEAEKKCERLKEEKTRLEIELDTLRPKVGDLSDKNVRMLQVRLVWSVRVTLLRVFVGVKLEVSCQNCKIGFWATKCYCISQSSEAKDFHITIHTFIVFLMIIDPLHIPCL